MISRKTTSCPSCSFRVFSVYDKDGWRITCSHCDYSSASCKTELEAEVSYREDLNAAIVSIESVPLPSGDGWNRYSDRLPELIPQGDGRDHRPVEVVCSDNSMRETTVNGLHEDKGMFIVYWRWYQ